MRTLLRLLVHLLLFLLLCAGVAALLVCWPVALFVLGGVLTGSFGLWLITGAGLVLFLLLAALFLTLPALHRIAGRERSQDLLMGGYLVFLGIGAAAFFVAGLVAGGAGRQIYHAREGIRAEAVITDTRPVYSAMTGSRTGTSYRVVDAATRQDYGWMDDGLARKQEKKGDRLEISVDPRGQVAPVAAETLGWVDGWETVLIVCYGVTAVSALSPIGAALVLWVRPPKGT